MRPRVFYIGATDANEINEEYHRHHRSDLKSKSRQIIEIDAKENFLLLADVSGDTEE